MNNPNHSKKRSFAQTRVGGSACPTFASVRLAQQHYDEMFANADLFTARVVLVPHHKQQPHNPNPTKLVLNDLSLTECVSSWTLLFSYTEAENNEHSQLHQTSEGETSGSVSPFGFISTAYLHLRASKSTAEIDVQKSWCYDQMPKFTPDPTFDFYTRVPQFDNAEFEIPQLEEAAALRCQLLFDLWNRRWDGKTSARVRKSPACTDLLYLKSKTQVELDFVTFMLLAVAFKQNTRRYKLSRKQFEEMKDRWLQMEQLLYEHRLITCFANVLDEFMEPSIECYSRAVLESGNPPTSPIGDYMNTFVPQCKKSRDFTK